QYAGSTQSHPTAVQQSGFVTSGNGLSQNSHLTIENLESAAVQNSTWIHYFDVGVTFDGEFDQNETLRILIFNVTTSGGIQLVTPQGEAGGTGQKYFGFNLIS